MVSNEIENNSGSEITDLSSEGISKAEAINSNSHRLAKLALGDVILQFSAHHADHQRGDKQVERLYQQIYTGVIVASRETSFCQRNEEDERDHHDENTAELKANSNRRLQLIEELARDAKNSWSKSH